jgi:hypothetical protein
MCATGARLYAGRRAGIAASTIEAGVGSVLLAPKLLYPSARYRAHNISTMAMIKIHHIVTPHTMARKNCSPDMAQTRLAGKKIEIRRVLID